MMSSPVNHVVCLLFLFSAVTNVKVRAACDKHTVEQVLDIRGYHPTSVAYNVCVDNTTIRPNLSYESTGFATFIRECCGCRVSSVTEGQVRLRRKGKPAEFRTVYIPEIHACQCIPCDNNVYRWSDYFLGLNHKRKK